LIAEELPNLTLSFMEKIYLHIIEPLNQVSMLRPEPSTMQALEVHIIVSSCFHFFQVIEWAMGEYDFVRPRITFLISFFASILSLYCSIAQFFLEPPFL
jgi:hypothetical protein